MDRHDLSPLELLLVAGAAALALVGGVVWAGACVAAVVAGSHLHADLGDALRAAGNLPHHLSRPVAAWPPAQAGALPGALTYWVATAAVALPVLAVVAVVARVVLRSRVGTVPRRPLGVDARARFAASSDLRPLVVGRTHPGRFLLGRAGRDRLATEVMPKRRRRRWRHQGDRGAVALIGPSRSGKTTAAVSGILCWDGPAVLSSVKADLLATTAGWRRRQGEVLVYDPTATTGAATASDRKSVV